MSRLLGSVPWPSARHSRATGQERERAERDALHLLREGPCGVCRERDDATRRWLTYFAHESHTDQGVMARLGAAAGFCPAHTRHLLADTSASWLLPPVHDAALTGGQRLLADTSTGPGPCPACVNGADAEDRALQTVIRAVDRPPVREAVADEAMCLPHMALLATRTGADDGGWLAGAALAHLERQRTGMSWLAGMDPDATARALLHPLLDPLLRAEQHQQQRAVLDRWDADIALVCCPLCLAEHRAARRLLRWAATSTDSRRPAREETGLCPRHLHDLTALGGPSVSAVVADNRARWSDQLTRFRESAPRGRAARRTAAAQLLRPPDCRACAEEHTAVRRQAALLAAAVRDPVRARAFEHAHGICLRHALDHSGALPSLVRTVLDARLALLRWEVDEWSRRQDWHTRHEAKGAEMAVGRRAPSLLDGHVYAGLPAQPHLAAPPHERQPAAED
ncbi:hypothetical protein VT50_0221265 [Streptomyces antioxidans]|uniref:Uncharacterized protein n=1 Tax=Streptomyces antioxidans TaxID=1507734 RepID=A0A1V4D1Z5_9ACTN|nr:hypothetical protein [Streptomyces antioxidans]OPF77312.1 hypothetical protein VT50_0221265 [Streptomyces antioxidans]